MVLRKVSRGGGFNNWTLLLIVAAVAIFGGLLVAVVARPLKVFEAFTTPAVNIEYYSMNGCGHCETFDKKVWEPLTKDVATKSVNFKLVKYNLSEPAGAERAKKFNVTSTPTILAVKNDKMVDSFEGDRTVDNVYKFAEKNSK